MCTMSNYELGTHILVVAVTLQGYTHYETMNLVTLPHYSTCCEMLHRCWFVVLFITPPVCLVSALGAGDEPGGWQVHSS